MFCDLLGQDIRVIGFNAPGWGCGSKSGTSVFMSFSDTQCLFKKIALLMEILKGSLFLHLMTIGANTLY